MLLTLISATDFIKDFVLTNGFLIRTNNNQVIRFRFYIDDAPVTTAAFIKLLPFTRHFLHARVSGQEIWTDHAPWLDIIQENVSVFTTAGEIVIGPSRPPRNKVINCMGIFYGEGKLLDGGNIFGKAAEEDMPLLKTLGEQIWKEGGQSLTFELAQ